MSIAGCASPRTGLEAVRRTAEPAIASTVWRYTSSYPAAQLGTAMAVANLNGDAYDDLVVSEPVFDSGSGPVEPGAVRVFYGSPNGFGAMPDLSVVGTIAGSRFGAAVVGCDVDGNGYTDLVVGAPDAGTNANGLVLVYPSDANGPNLASPHSILAPSGGVSFGTALACARLGTGAYEDLLIGDPDSTDNAVNGEGLVHVFYGSASGPSSAPGLTLSKNIASQHFGAAIANAGDVNGNGWDDVLVGAPSDQSGATAYGSVYVYFGDAATFDATSDWELTSTQGSSLFGAAVSSASDINGDGFGDLVFGEPGFDDSTSGNVDAGRAWVFHGGSGGPGANANWTAVGPIAGAKLGTSVAGIGDVTGDTKNDLLVGLPGANEGNGNLEGGVAVYAGGTSGASLDPVTTYYSGSGSTFLGSSVSRGANFDGDGKTDFALGGIGSSGTGFSFEGGVVFVFFTKTFSGGDGGVGGDGGSTPALVHAPSAGLCSAALGARRASSITGLVAFAVLALAIRRRARRYASVVAPIIFMIAFGASSARADAPPDLDAIARAHFETGQQYYEAGHFAEAASEFMRAYELSHHAALLHNAYVAYRDAGDRPHALAALERFAAEEPNADSPVMRARIEALRQEVEADARAQASETGPRASDTASTPDSSGAAEESGASSAPSSVAGPSRGTSEDEHARHARRVGVILVVTGGAVAVLGFTTGSAMLVVRESRLDSYCGPTANPPLPSGTCYDSSTVDEVRRSTPALRGVAYGSLAVGASLATVGLVRILTHRSHDDAPSVGAACDGHGCAASIRGRF